jgi:hypothetical protein
MVALKVDPGTTATNTRRWTSTTAGVVVGMAREGHADAVDRTVRGNSACSAPSDIRRCPRPRSPRRIHLWSRAASNDDRRAAERWYPSGTPHVLPSLPGNPSSMRTHDISLRGSSGVLPVHAVLVAHRRPSKPLALPSGYRRSGRRHRRTTAHRGTVGTRTASSRPCSGPNEGRAMTVIGTPNGMRSYGNGHQRRRPGHRHGAGVAGAVAPVRARPVSANR